MDNIWAINIRFFRIKSYFSYNYFLKKIITKHWFNKLNTGNQELKTEQRFLQPFEEMKDSAPLCCAWLKWKHVVVLNHPTDIIFRLHSIIFFYPLINKSALDGRCLWDLITQTKKESVLIWPMVLDVITPPVKNFIPPIEIKIMSLYVFLMNR